MPAGHLNTQEAVQEEAILKATRTIMVLSLAGAATLAAAPLAGARSAYLQQVKEQFDLAESKVVTDAGCQYCHVKKVGGAPWNAFGEKVREFYMAEAKRDVGQALYLTLKADEDSDADGYADALEVLAKTLPGDAKSKPTKTVAALKADLKAAGGVEAYKPE
jgi:ABC-type Zn uptake system ZnuABC Zn-binding protein ZnuA